MRSWKIGIELIVFGEKDYDIFNNKDKDSLVKVTEYYGLRISWVKYIQVSLTVKYKTNSKRILIDKGLKELYEDRGDILK